MKILSAPGKIVLAILLVASGATIWLWPRYAWQAPIESPYIVARFDGNPVIRTEMSERLSEIAGRDGYTNINGPTVIRVPDWVVEPLGRYYLYFAHHKGDFIRLAYADDPLGPWTVYEPGALAIADSGFPAAMGKAIRPADAVAELWVRFSPYVVRDYLMLNHTATVTDVALRIQRGIAGKATRYPHIASPDVLVDNEAQRFYLYYHGMQANGTQRSRVAISADGIHFSKSDAAIFSTYLRAFVHAGTYYLLGMPGVLYRADNPLGPFEPRGKLVFEPDMRHAGLLLQGQTLYVFWSRAGDAPESILLSAVDLSSNDWNDWTASAGIELLRPQLEWEGSELPVMTSLRGEIPIASHELRDPYVLRDDDGALYLYYAGAGEQAIGVARLLGMSERARP